MNIILLLSVAILTLSNYAVMNAENSDTITTTSGLKYVYTHHGNGERTKAGWLMIVHYTGTFLDGKKFDSSRDRKTPFSFVLGKGQVIKGWDEAVSLLRIGDRATLIVPYQLAYGEKGRGLIPPKSTLVFDVEVLDMKEKSLGIVISDILFADTNHLNLQGCTDRVRELKANNFNNIYVSESELNIIGYRLLTKMHNPKAAIEIMKLNVELYPDSGNSYDSLAEAYLENGDKELAIKYYLKSLELDSKNTNAFEMLEKLQAK